MKKSIMNGICLVLGFILTGIGSVGVILPVLPTTPFLLLASFFFARGSKKFHRWFMNTRLYKKHLESFVTSRAMTFKTKCCILLPASALLMVAFFICPVWYGRLLVGIVFVFKYYYFFTQIRTIRKEVAAE